MTDKTITRRCIHGRSERQTCAKCNSPIETIVLVIAQSRTVEKSDRRLAEEILNALEEDEWTVTR